MRLSIRKRYLVLAATVLMTALGWTMVDRVFPSPQKRLRDEIAALDAVRPLHVIRSLDAAEFSHLCLLPPYRDGRYAHSPYDTLLGEALSSVQGTSDDGQVLLLLIRPDGAVTPGGKPSFHVTSLSLPRGARFDLSDRPNEISPPAGFTPIDCAAVGKAALARLEPPGPGSWQKFIFGEQTVGE